MRQFSFNILSLSILILFLLLSLELSTSHAGARQSEAERAQFEGCNNCHRVIGISNDPFIPKLAGQKQKYMLRQLQQMAKLSTADKGGNTRYHRLSELMTNGVTQRGLYQITRYYADMGCS